MKIPFVLKNMGWIFGGLLLFCSCSSVVQTDGEEPLTYQVFYDHLSPYGTWIEYPGYGAVWNPNIRGDFSPYLTNGHWQATTAGWAWVSGYSWGWATFHYGRWYYDNRFGWLWIPGYEWSPAWVVWGSAADYYCWAPLMPGIDVTIIYDSWSPPPFYWNLCPRPYLTHTHLHHNTIRGDGVRPGTRINTLRNFQTTSTHHLYYATGPAFEEVQRETRTTITPIPIETSKSIPNRATSTGMRVYSPSIETPEMQQRRSAKPIPSVYRSADMPRQNSTTPTIPDIQRKTQRNNIKSLPQERSTKRR
ncbi:DUF6600 domain-containing protein [Flavobacterium sp. 102]|uniref:DUF6600 domain-containing protein n=1 Tax=Flavobacterium sp. 102 TaxID=2135623 RepID=UPI000F1DCBEB|nr:DUF6600 domain-containing protein [Flavobacterium sp. 102]RKS03596.1 hypothetical protein C8C84_3357 [Flavobacterium sp. 102]